MVLFLISTLLNLLLKDFFHTKRPFEKLSNFTGKRLETATGYSFPSGHTQGATTLFINLSQIFKKPVYLIIAVFICLLVAVSRVYLGAHWPVDVVGGLVAGIFVVLVFYPWLKRVYDEKARFNRLINWIAFISGFLVLVVFGLSKIGLSFSIDIKYYIVLTGIIYGCVLGYRLEDKKVRFINSAPAWLKITRYFLGLSVSILLLSGVKKILPEYLIFDFFRYFIVGFWLTGIFPAFGIMLGLFRKEKVQDF